jgi:hypothetical protein
VENESTFPTKILDGAKNAPPWESILHVLSVTGRNNLRCLNHARVIISSGSRHHSETATSAGSIPRERTLFHPLQVAGNRHKLISGIKAPEFPEPTDASGTMTLEGQFPTLVVLGTGNRIAGTKPSAPFAAR